MPWGTLVAVWGLRRPAMLDHTAQDITSNQVARIPAELLDGYRESQDIVEHAWEDFQDKKNPTMLLEGITQSIHRMKLLQDR